jgi:hypothetical protein
MANNKILFFINVGYFIFAAKMYTFILREFGETKVPWKFRFSYWDITDTKSLKVTVLIEQWPLSINIHSCRLDLYINRECTLDLESRCTYLLWFRICHSFQLTEWYRSLVFHFCTGLCQSHLCNAFKRKHQAHWLQSGHHETPSFKATQCRFSEWFSLL